MNPAVKASLAPDLEWSPTISRRRPDAVPEQARFNTVGYGCTTCIGNSGPLDPAIEDAVVKNDLVTASVLSGNRNFEARVHQNVKSNFLMSPPLVVAFRPRRSGGHRLELRAARNGKDGQPVYLADLWPTLQEVRDAMQSALKPEVFRKLYKDFAAQNPKWNEIPSSVGNVRVGREIHPHPGAAVLHEFRAPAGIHHPDHRGAGVGHLRGQRDHGPHLPGRRDQEIVPGRFLQENGVEFADFNSYGSRRGNDRIMTRGTFANVRIKEPHARR